MSAIRITSITVRNLGPIADAVIQIDNKPLVIFYGEVRQGKTTIHYWTAAKAWASPSSR